MILLKLILAHLTGDFLLQPKSWVEEKEEKKIRSVKLYGHIILHGALVLLVLWDYSFWLLALMIMGLHGIIDILKLYVQKEHNKTKWFAIDQLLHLASIFILWSVWFPSEMDFSKIYNNPVIWLYAAALLFLTKATGITIQVLMLNWSKAVSDGENESLASAGKYIGILERLFVFVFVVNGHWEAVGFLLAAKSVFRFGDLKESKDRKLTEYILIGTLLSFGIAIVTGIIVLKIAPIL
jgi:hypothetical protein